jgi:hypothetical protein
MNHAKGHYDESLARVAGEDATMGVPTWLGRMAA